MQLCIQSYLSEELYFIAVTARTTTGTDVWETLLVNHICSQVEVLTEKKLDWQSQGWGRRSWRYDVALFPSPSLLHFCISCRFVSRSSLCLYFRVYFISMSLILPSCCSFPLANGSRVLFMLFIFAVPLYLSIRLSIGRYALCVTSYLFIRLSVCFLFLSFIVYMYFLSFLQPQPNHIHTRGRTTCHKQTLEQDVIRKQSNLWLHFLSSLLIKYLYYI